MKTCLLLRIVRRQQHVDFLCAFSVELVGNIVNTTTILSNDTICAHAKFKAVIVIVVVSAAHTLCQVCLPVRKRITFWIIKVPEPLQGRGPGEYNLPHGGLAAPIKCLPRLVIVICVVRPPFPF